MSQPPATSGDLRVLQAALKRLLAEPGGEAINGGAQFRGVVWRFLEALCQVPGAEELLEGYGDFVRVNTAPGTPYAKAWESGRRHVVEGFPLVLQESSMQKESAFALDSEREALENVLYKSYTLTGEVRRALEDEAKREDLDIALCGRLPLTDEAQRDLLAWWRIVCNLAAHAQNHYVDGCSHLLQMHWYGLNAFATRLASAFHKDIKPAAKFLVGQVEAGAVDAGTVKLEGRKKRKGKRGPKGPRYDEQEDRKVFDGWQTWKNNAGERSIEAYAKKKCGATQRKKIVAIERAIAREQKRRRRKGQK